MKHNKYCCFQLSSPCCVPLFSELLQCMLGGVQSHLDSSVVRIRRVGMVVGECLSSRMDLNGTKLKFEVQSVCEPRDTMPSVMTAD